MTVSLLPLLRQAAACLDRARCTAAGRFAVVVGIAVAIAGSAHAATPFEVRVTGAGPDVLLIPGLASSGAVWDDTVRQQSPHFRCHVLTLAAIHVPTLVMGSWIGDKDTTSDAARAIYERQYAALAGAQFAMSPAGRHFIMLDDPQWFEATLEAFIR